VIHGFLAMSLKQMGAQSSNDFLQLFDSQASHRLNFSSLGWAPQVNATTPFVGVVDMGPYLDFMQTGNVNLWVSDNTGVDWALYTVAVSTPKADEVGPAVFLDGGEVRVDSTLSPLALLSNGGLAASELTLASSGRVTVNGGFVQAANSAMLFEIAGADPTRYGKFTIGGGASLDGEIKFRSVGGFVPVVGSTFQIITAAGGFADSQFESSLTADLTTGALWAVEYQPTAVVARVIASLFGDLTGDGAMTAADWTQFKAGQGANFSGLSSGDAYLLGDFDGDFDHDLEDFSRFRLAYESANGAGAFAAMLARVPEPSSALLALGAAAFLRHCGRRLRRRYRCVVDYGMPLADATENQRPIGLSCPQTCFRRQPRQLLARFAAAPRMSVGTFSAHSRGRNEGGSHEAGSLARNLLVCGAVGAGARGASRARNGILRRSRRQQCQSRDGALAVGNAAVCS
jgi:hypothetical protein